MAQFIWSFDLFCAWFLVLLSHGLNFWYLGSLVYFILHFNVGTMFRAVGGILIIDNLVMKNLLLVNWCCLCWCDEETVDHLLLRCKFAHALWSEVFLMFGVQCVMLNVVPACLMWLIWKEYNARTFEHIEKPIDLLKTSLVRTLFEWSCIWGA